MKATLKPFPLGVGAICLGPFQYSKKERVAVYALRVKCLLVCSMQSNSNLPTQVARSFVLAEREGFEPSDRFPGQQLSRLLHSTALAPLRESPLSIPFLPLVL